VGRSKSPSNSFIPDAQQREAIEHVRGPMIVVAGAGTGKTSVLIRRIAALVDHGHARPDEIIALTFTKSSAAEMLDRVSALLGGTPINAATFHDYANGLLARAGRAFGVLEERDLWIYLRRRIRDFHLQHYIRAANVSEFLNDLLEFMGRCHDELVTPEKYAGYVSRLERGELQVPRVVKSKVQLEAAEVLGRCQEIARVFTLTERWLAEENVGTFSHMITRAYALLQSDANLLAEERSRARFILVDEFQDVNFAQIKLLSALAGTEANIFAVGDPDQGIYRFRGASSAAFELFRRHFPEARPVVLKRNRRSTTPILRCAFELIEGNPPAFADDISNTLVYKREPLESVREEDAAREGAPINTTRVQVVTWAGKQAEAPDVVDVLRETRGRLRCRWRDFAVLYRQHSNRDEVVQELAEAEIPFVIEGFDISDTGEARDLFACLSAVVSMSDDVSMFRVAALGSFEVDPQQLRSAMRALARSAREGQAVPLASVLHEVAGGAAVLAAVNKARDEVRKRNARGRRALEIIAVTFGFDPRSRVLQSALTFVQSKEASPLTKTGELDELVAYLRDFREAGGTIPMTSDPTVDAVRLMTVHQAKGLEFPHVLIVRVGPGSFPTSYHESLVGFPADLRDPDSAATGRDSEYHKQEERRLLYVAMTRARDRLDIYAKQGSGADKTPSGDLRRLLTTQSLKPYLQSRMVRGDQRTLSIAASAGPMLARTSHINDWVDLKATPGLASNLSASSVDTYERCPLRFKLERDWKMSRDTPAALRYGAAMHQVLRAYGDAVLSGRPIIAEEMVAQFRAALAGTKIADAYQHDLYERQGVQQLQDFLAGARSSPPPEVLHTEEQFEIKIGKTTVVGRIDRVDRHTDGGVVIVDYKTGKARDQEDADESLQLSLYAVAAREKWGYHVSSLVLHNLEGNVPISTTRADSDLTKARDRVEAAAAGIEAEDFSANTGFHCGFCPYRSLCPAKEKRIPMLAGESGPG